MSKEGIKLTAQIFTLMQMTRHRLFAIATTKSKVDKQDIILAQILERGQEVMKDDFTKATFMRNTR